MCLFGTDGASFPRSAILALEDGCHGSVGNAAARTEGPIHGGGVGGLDMTVGEAGADGDVFAGFVGVDHEDKGVLHLVVAHADSLEIPSQWP